MSLILAESKLPALIIAHLEARRTDADYPTPAANLVTLHAGPFKGTTRSYPCLEVWVASHQCVNRRDEEQCEIIMDLHADKDADTTLTTELGWLAAFRRSFAGGPLPAGANASNSSTNPFLAYCNALDDTASDGWEVFDFHLTGGQVLIDDQQRVIYRTTARAILQTYVLTV